MSRVRHYTSKLSVVAVMTVGALVFSACGSSGGSNKSASPSGGAATGSSSTLTGTPIVIGAIGSKSGPNAKSVNQGFTVAPAWADWVNANGGINGHPVKVELADDGADPAKAQAAAKDLIDNKHISALVVFSDQVFAGYAGYAVSKKIPVIGGQFNATPWYTLGGTYATSTDQVSLLKGIVQAAKTYGKAKKFAFAYCSDVASCAQAVPIVKAASDKAGIGFTSLAISSTAPDYTAECLKLQQAKVDFVLPALAAVGTAKFVQDCQAQGYNPTWGTTSVGVGPEVLALKNFTAYGPSDSFPTTANSPLVTTYKNAMKKYAEGDNWLGGVAPNTWDGLEMLRKAMGTITGTVTPASVTTALNSIKNENLGGLLANKITYTAGKPAAYGSLPCYFVIAVKNGKEEAPGNLTPQCAA